MAGKAQIDEIERDLTHGSQSERYHGGSISTLQLYIELAGTCLEMAICDHCEASSPESSKYCTMCGCPMPGIAQIYTGRIIEGDGPRCRKCSAGNPKHSDFCNACGRYLRWRQSLAILLLLASATFIAAWLAWRLWRMPELPLLALPFIYLVYWAFFGIGSTKPYWQWKARRQWKREMKIETDLSEKRP